MDDKKKPNKTYSDEFKEEAVALSYKEGLSEAARKLGISTSTLGTWRKNQRADRSKKPTYDELEKEVRRLKKELGYIEEINKVLKKSTAIFSSSLMGGFK